MNLSFYLKLSLKVMEFCIIFAHLNLIVFEKHLKSI